MLIENPPQTSPPYRPGTYLLHVQYQSGKVEAHSVAEQQEKGGVFALGATRAGRNQNRDNLSSSARSVRSAFPFRITPAHFQNMGFLTSTFARSILFGGFQKARMACSSCSSGDGAPRGCGNKGHCASGSCGQLSVFNYLSDMRAPGGQKSQSMVEVRFKGTRKGFYRLPDELKVNEGDVVAVDANPGHDVGVVTLTGDLVPLQMKRKKAEMSGQEVRKVLRIGTQNDIDTWRTAVAREDQTTFKARSLARSNGLDIKVTDVEFQGDGTKALFYYVSENRVDFRDIVRVFSELFKIKVEMRQISPRQEAGRLGGIGICGRELCCSTWLTDFRTVTTSAARYQQLSLNPQKLSGQCGKLKCCLNYELDAYLDAIKDFPDQRTKIETEHGQAVPMKVDIFKGVMWYALKSDMSIFIPLTTEKVKEYAAMNKRGEKVRELVPIKMRDEVKAPTYENVVGQDELTRFDRKPGERDERNRRKKNRNRGNRDNRNDRGTRPSGQLPGGQPPSK